MSCTESSREEDCLFCTCTEAGILKTYPYRDISYDVVESPKWAKCKTVLKQYIDHPDSPPNETSSPT